MNTNKNPASVKSPLVLVAAGDDHFSMPLAVSLFSAIRHLPEGVAVDIYLIDAGISATNRGHILRLLKRKLCNVIWITPNLEHLAGLLPGAWYSAATYLRLLLPEILPDCVSRAIYIDSDVVVCADLNDLWEQFSGPEVFAAVRDFWCTTAKIAMPNCYEQLGILPEARYANCGLLCINLDRWREEHISDRIFDVLRSRQGDFRYADQDGINAIAAGVWRELDPRWNVQMMNLTDYRPSMFPGTPPPDAECLLREARILHFTGPRKPWHLRYTGGAAHRYWKEAEIARWYPLICGRIWTITLLLCQTTARSLSQAKRRLLRHLSLKGESKCS